MNKVRRKQTEDIIARLQDLMADIELLQEEEQEYYDNMPESFQYGEKGEKAEASIDAYEEAISNIEEAISNLDTAIE